MKLDDKELYQNINMYMNKEVMLQGWIRNHRKQKDFGFIDFHDGTYFKSVQVVYDNKIKNFDDITKYHIGSSIMVKGKVIESPAKGQLFEIQAEMFLTSK